LPLADINSVGSQNGQIYNLTVMLLLNIHMHLCKNYSWQKNT